MIGICSVTKHKIIALLRFALRLGLLRRFFPSLIAHTRKENDLGC